MIERIDIPLDEAYGTGSLVAAFLDGQADIVERLGPPPSADGALANAVARAKAFAGPRAALAEALVAHNRRVGADDGAVAAAESLAEADTVVVVAGQQPGLLTGPLYTIFKAATALRVARRIAESHGARAVPMFWTAAEDHDSAEIDHVFVPSDEGPRRLRAKIDGGFRSVSDLGLAFWDDFRADVAGAIAGGDHAKETLALIDRARDGAANPAEMFARLMASLFAGTGLVLIAPNVLRPFAAEIVARELEEGGEQTNRLVAAAGDALRRAGHEPPLRPRARTLNVYLYENGLRSRLIADGRTRILSKVSGKTYTRAELAARARAAPEVFSTGVALRPVVQDAVLPTAVFVGGPSEIAYFAQLQGVHAHFDAAFPLMWPRVSATLVEPRAQKLARKLGAPPERLLAAAQAGRDDGGDDAAAADDPSARMAAITDAIVEQVGEMAHIAEDVDGKFAKTGRKIAEKTRRDLDKFTGKVRDAGRGDGGAASRERLAAAVWPRGGPQERTYNVMPYLARHGAALIGEIIEAVAPEAGGHQLLLIGGRGT